MNATQFFGAAPENRVQCFVFVAMVVDVSWLDVGFLSMSGSHWMSLGIADVQRLELLRSPSQVEKKNI
jgi:hypothetical protein